jgi:hypothetical protein
LELCYNDDGKYVTTGTFPDPGSPLVCSGVTYISAMPGDPTTNDSYLYGVDNNVNPQGFVIGTALESAANQALVNDINGTVYGVDCDGLVYCIKP